MRILFLIHSLGGGGAERVTTNLANHFAGLGHRVTIVTLSALILDVYPIHSSIKRVRLNLAGDSRSHTDSLLRLVRSVLAVRNILRRLQPDAAIGMMPNAAVLLALAGHPVQVKLLGSERVFPPAVRLPIAWRALRKLTYRKLDAVVAQTAQVAEWLQLNTRARTVVIPNPWMRVKNAEPQVAAADIVPDGAKLVLGAGRLLRQKRFDLLIEAFARCAVGRGDWHLAIAGEGPLIDELRSLADLRGVAERVTFLGHVGNLAEWYERCDVFVLSSEFEGFPNVLLEAMSCGAASLAFDCPTGPADLIRSGENGFLVEPLSLDDLADRLGQLMDDIGLRHRLGKAAIEVREQYSVERVADAWLAEMAK